MVFSPWGFLSCVSIDLSMLYIIIIAKRQVKCVCSLGMISASGLRRASYFLLGSFDTSIVSLPRRTESMCLFVWHRGYAPTNHVRLFATSYEQNADAPTVLSQVTFIRKLWCSLSQPKHAK